MKGEGRRLGCEERKGEVGHCQKPYMLLEESLWINMLPKAVHRSWSQAKEQVMTCPLLLLHHWNCSGGGCNTAAAAC